jgi:hypothetical protein
MSTPSLQSHENSRTSHILSFLEKADLEWLQAVEDLAGDRNLDWVCLVRHLAMRETLLSEFKTIIGDIPYMRRCSELAVYEIP